MYIYHVKVSEENMKILEVNDANLKTLRDTIKDIKNAFPNSWKIPLYKDILKCENDRFNYLCKNILEFEDVINDNVNVQYRISPPTSEILIYSQIKLDINCDKMEVK